MYVSAVEVIIRTVHGLVPQENSSKYAQLWVGISAMSGADFVIDRLAIIVGLSLSVQWNTGVRVHTARNVCQEYPKDVPVRRCHRVTLQTPKNTTSVTNVMVQRVKREKSAQLGNACKRHLADKKREGRYLDEHRER